MQPVPAIPPTHGFWNLPIDAARHGPALDSQLQLNLWIALALLVLAHIVLFAGLALRKRASHSTNTLLLEYLPLAGLMLLFAFLGWHAQRLWAAQRYTGPAPNALQVEVTGKQFVWYFRYPGADATFGRTSLALVAPAAGNPLGIDPHDSHGADDLVSSLLVLPAGREVDLAVRSQDVIHGFAVPQMRIKQNAVPGQTAHIHFTPELAGDYAILCTQVCGLGHYRMQATLRVLPPAAFAAWLHGREAARSRELQQVRSASLAAASSQEPAPAPGATP